jgi:hypothetical protein
MILHHTYGVLRIRGNDINKRIFCPTKMNVVAVFFVVIHFLVLGLNRKKI